MMGFVDNSLQFLDQSCFNFLNFQIIDDLQTPSSESSNFCKSRKLPPAPMVLQIMEMGFSRKSVELAIKSMGKFLQFAFQIN